MDIFHLMIAARYARLPNPDASAFLEGWMHRGDIGLRSLVTGILMAENKWDLESFPDTFREVIDEELAQSGLPASVIKGSRGAPASGGSAPSR